MMPMGVNSDDWVAAIASYVRRSFGNTASFVSPADVARVRAATGDRKTSWTIQELTASLPSQLQTDGWKAAASHNPDDASAGLRLTTWSSGAAQAAGMWFQVELQNAETITELSFQSPPAAERGAAVAAGGAPTNTPTGPGFPRAFRVEVSVDGNTWQGVAEGTGAGTTTTVTFNPVIARFVRITLTSGVENGPPWSIQSLKVYRVAKP